MSSPQPVTQRDVARECGVHPSTICLALGNSVAIPAATRDRILDAVRRLGYRPNAAARNLAAMRNDKASNALLPIAWLNQERTRDFWRVDPVARRQYEAAQRRAEELGYYLEDFWMAEPEMTPKRMIQIVGARGIRGVVFPIHSEFSRAVVCADWIGFATVGLGDHRTGDWHDLVCADYYRNTDLVLREARQRGFQRIGLLLDNPFVAKTDGITLSRYCLYQDTVREQFRVPPCITPEERELKLAAFRAWYLRWSPDAVICNGPDIADWARLTGFQVAFLQLDVVSDDGLGVDGCAGEIAATAIDCVVEKIRRSNRGGYSSRRHLVAGVWHESRASDLPSKPRVFPHFEGIQVDWAADRVK